MILLKRLFSFLFLSIRIFRNCYVAGVDIPPEWISYVEKITRQFDDKPWAPVCITYSEITTSEAITHNFIPNIILWDPIVQFPALSNAFQHCLVEDCKHVLEGREWQNGRNQVLMPRVIHAIDGIVLLVSRNYVCKSGHRYLSHDERILDRLPSSAHLPFILTHRSGLTMQCLSLVVSLIGEGEKISSVEHALQETRRETYYRNILCSVELQKNRENTILPKFEQSLNYMLYPGSKLLLSSFLQYFWKHELYYRQRMHNICINDDWICCDHTFKSVTNIGIYQTRDNQVGKWVKQFKSFFIVLNDMGQILSWQLVSDTSYDSLWEMLTEVSTRLQAKNKTLREIYVDDCCKVRNRLQDIFDEETMIKLDLFHAVQRVTKKASKRHSLFKDFVSSLKHVFRDPNDLGDVRKLCTPEPDILENNINYFIQCWKDVKSHDGKVILTPPVLEQINRLRSHITKGCLSYIKPGRGTNRDESLHRRINNFMKYSKIGTELAYSLIVASFDTINEQRKETSERQSIIQYVTELKMGTNSESTSVTPKFGLTTRLKIHVLNLVKRNRRERGYYRWTLYRNTG